MATFAISGLLPGSAAAGDIEKLAGLNADQVAAEMRSQLAA